jgi:CelD/BcsL family acetyltransferase involved in cellulose biosynthesis
MDESTAAVPGAAAVEWQTQGCAVSARTVRTTAELDLLAPQWDAVARTPIQRFAWARAAARACPDDALHVVVVLLEERAPAIAPLVRRGPFARLELIGNHALHEPMDFLYSDAHAAELLATELCRSGSPIRLERVPADSAVVPAIERTMRGRGLVMTRTEAGCPWIPLDETPTDPVGMFNAGRRSDLRRFQRHAETFGAVTYEVVRPTLETVDGLLDEAFRVEAASWKGRTGTAVATDAGAQRFFRSYAGQAVSDGILRISFLRIDGRAIAMQIAAECFDRFWLLKIGYDEAYARSSPGSLLMLHTLRYAAASGLKSCELLGTDEPWTRAWTHHVRPCVSVRTYPANARGLAALAVDAIEAAWLKTESRLRAA